jgi:hypothetical protein
VAWLHAIESRARDRGVACCELSGRASLTVLRTDWGLTRVTRVGRAVIAVATERGWFVVMVGFACGELRVWNVLKYSAAYL